MSLIARTAAMILTAFGLLFIASGTATAETATASEVSQSSKVQGAALPLTSSVNLAGPNIAGPYLTRSECEAAQWFYDLVFDEVSNCFFDVPSRAFYFTYEDTARSTTIGAST
jgi:hypothetical protein